MQDFSVQTRSRTELVDITAEVRAAVAKEGVRDGLCLVFCPHTTAGVTINENADPDVVADMLRELNKVVPLEDGYRHGEGNSSAHIKSSLVGCSETLIVRDGRLVFGAWQGVYLCEFDGPRARRVLVQCAGTS